MAYLFFNLQFYFFLCSLLVCSLELHSLFFLRLLCPPNQTKEQASVNPPNGSVVVLERRTNPSTGLQWFELEPQALQLLNLPSYFDQQKFRLLDDLASSTTAIDCFRPCRTPGETIRPLFILACLLASIS